MMTYRAINLPSIELACSNKIFVSPSDYQRLLSQVEKEPIYVEISGFVFIAQSHPAVTEGIAMGKLIRKICHISLIDSFELKIFNSPLFYLGLMNIDVELPQIGPTIEISKRLLENAFRENMNDLVFNQNQILFLRFRNCPLLLTIWKVEGMNLINQEPQIENFQCQRGILHPQTLILFNTRSSNLCLY
ncbi:unnamed protein product [Blepharisma stoltei]|uniref:Vesicle-fusing ATPase n=1 Tax=Blepharisma stoltei TaxID=1481888 RepID=A0AAU9J879_9CILI|nr:unnamed protein product [Blepharisma stoltei]